MAFEELWRLRNITMVVNIEKKLEVQFTPATNTTSLLITPPDDLAASATGQQKQRSSAYKSRLAELAFLHMGDCNSVWRTPHRAGRLRSRQPPEVPRLRQRCVLQ
ncbi:hypothetical protein H101_08115, partial [Trichophyton interdigitale H6]